MDLIEERHAAGKVSVDRDVVVDNVGLKREHFWLGAAGCRRDRLNLDIAKAIIREARMPSLLSTRQSVVKEHRIVGAGARAGLSNGSIRIQ